MKKHTLICLALTTTLCSCVGYQNVRVFEKDENNTMQMTKQIKAFIVGTSGQKIKGHGLEIEKKDTTDKAVDLVENGIAAGIKIAASNKGV